MAMPLIAGLEIGTTHTVVCVGEMQRDGKMRILGCGKYPTAGVRKGQIIDTDQARVGVANAVKAASAKAQVNVWQVLMAIANGHILAESKTEKIPIRTRNKIPREDDIETVKELAGNIAITADRDMLHTLVQAYTVDDQAEVAEPPKIAGNMLACSRLGIHCPKNHVMNARPVAENAKLEVTDVAFAGVCAAKAVLSGEQKENGVVLIDLGGGTTSYIAFTHGILRTAGCVAVGGSHVTKDIAAAFHRLGLKRAEDLKCREGSATVIGADTDSPRIRISHNQTTDLDDLNISRRALNTVINARMNELFCILRERLDETGVLSNLGAGEIVLTGGGAYLRNVADLAKRVFGAPCSIGKLQNVDGLQDEEMPASLATAAGLVVYGYEGYEDTGIFGVFRNLFGKGSKS